LKEEPTRLSPARVALPFHAAGALFRSLPKQSKQAGTPPETPTRPAAARLALLVHPARAEPTDVPMPSRLFLLPTLVFALLGLSACDGSNYRHRGGEWAHGDASFTPQDPSSFQPLDERFARDRDSVFFCETYRNSQEYWSILHLRIVRIDGADAATYVSLDKGYARDKHRVYLIGMPFTVRNAASFEPLTGDFARDAQRGYHGRVEIPGSHGPTFQGVDERDTACGRDHANGYYGYRDQARLDETGKPRRVVRTLRRAQPAALRVLGRDYAADAHHVWHEGQLVVGADPSTFVVDETQQESADAKDKSGTWNAGQRVVASK